MNKLIVEIEADWGDNEYLIFNNEKDLKDYYSDSKITIYDTKLIIEKNGLKTYGKINWGKQI